MASIDNELYNRPGDIWWDDSQFLSLLRISLNPARFGYFRRVLREEMGLDPTGLTALDIGCGGGSLAEEFARLGCRVTGIDPSEPSLRAARAHALRSNLDIDYRRAAGESLPFPDRSFDIAYCCDVLEHVADVPRVIREAARVLRPGGIFLFDTINRTAISNLVVIKLLQDWDLTRFNPPRLHVWPKFIRPRELRRYLAEQGLESRGIVGLRPAANPLTLLRMMRQHRREIVTFADLARAAVFTESRLTAVMYAGYAVKRA